MPEKEEKTHQKMQEASKEVAIKKVRDG